MIPSTINVACTETSRADPIRDNTVRVVLLNGVSIMPFRLHHAALRCAVERPHTTPGDEFRFDSAVN